MILGTEHDAAKALPEATITAAGVQQYEVMLERTLQTIHCASAGRSGVLAQFLAPNPQLASEIASWVDDLVATATSLDIVLNTRDVRSFFSTPIEVLEDVATKSHPNQLQGYGCMDAMSSQVLEQWCANADVLLSTLICVSHDTCPPPATHTAIGQAFPEILPLSRYQRNAFSAYLQVANEACISLDRLLHLARNPYRPLFSSSLTTDTLACCEAACAGLASLFECGHQWIAEKPVDRRHLMVLEHLDSAHISLMLLFERTPDRQRQHALRDLLMRVSNIKRHI